MIDARTLFVVLVVTNLVLAASLWVGSLRTRRDGIGAWIAGLGFQAGGFAIFASGGDASSAASLVVANGLLAAALASTAWAIAAFRHRQVPRIWPVAFVALMVAVTAATSSSPSLRVASASAVLAAGLLGSAWFANQPMDDVMPATRGLFVGSYLLAGAGLAARVLFALVLPGESASFATAEPVLHLPVLVAYATTLSASVAFLLMQTERADDIAKRLASTDPLTGAYNRRTFLEIMEKELSRARRFSTPLAVIMLDLDHFKRINDTHGHVVGDKVLQRFADVVRSQLRKEDVLVRYGGEEFCVLLPDVPGTGAVALANRIREAVGAKPFDIDGLAIPVTTSAGVAARFEEGPSEVDDLVYRADEALYVAKRRGRDRVAAVSLGSRVA